MKPPVLCISIVSYRNKGGLERLVGQIEKHTHASYRLVITDNNSGDKDLLDYLKELERSAVVVLNRENLGYGAAHNAVVARGLSESYLCLLNDDVEILENDWDGILIGTLESYLRVGQVGPAGFCSAFNATAQGVPTNTAPEYIEGSCVMMHTRVVNEVVAKRGALFSSEYNKLYCEDSDLSLFLREQGYQIRVVPVKITHKTKLRASNLDVYGLGIANKQAFRVKWKDYFKTKTFAAKWLFVRRGHFGDVLLATPLFRQVKEKHSTHQVIVATDCGAYLEGNPHVDTVLPWAERNGLQADYRVDLDDAYEVRPTMNVVDAYRLLASFPDGDKTLVYVPGEDWLIRAQLAWNESNRKKRIAIDDRHTWAMREWNGDRWETLATRLREATGVKCLFLANYDPPKKAEHQLFGALIATAGLYVGFDGLGLHLSQACGVPSVSVWGGTRPEYRLTRPEIAKCVHANVACRGCLHKEISPIHFLECQRVDIKNKCMLDISPEMVFAISLEAINGKPGG